MISIIISSANKEFLKAVSNNIDETIGVTYEIIAVDNLDGSKGICEVYNFGIKQAKYDLLCFMHEDIEIKTKEWGQKVVSYFNQDKKLGVLGIAGSAYKGLVPSGWGVEGTKGMEFYNYVQAFKYSEKLSIHAYSNTGNVLIQPVVVVDGVWFVTTRIIASEVKFDDKLFKGFHCYDLDFCLNVGKNHTIAVAFDILLEHFSEGGYNPAWFYETLKLHDKWRSELPRCIVDISQSEKEKIEKRLFKRMLARLVDWKFEKKYILNLLKEYIKYSKTGFMSYLKLRLYFFKFRYFGHSIK